MGTTRGCRWRFKPVDARDSDESRAELRDADDDGGDVGGRAEPRPLEDLIRVVENRWLPGHLLEEDEADAGDERARCAAEQRPRARALLFARERTHHLGELRLDCRVRSTRAQPAQRRTRLADVGIGAGATDRADDEPSRRRRRDEQHAERHGDRERRGERPHRAPRVGAEAERGVVGDGHGAEAEEDAADDKGLLGADEQPAHRRRRDLGDVHRRRVHRECDAETVGEPTEPDGRQRASGRENGDGGAEEVEERTADELAPPTEHASHPEHHQRADKRAGERGGREHAVERRSAVKVVASATGRLLVREGACDVEEGA